MKPGSNNAISVAITPKIVLYRFGVFSLFIISMALLGLSHSNAPTITKLRSNIVDGATPIIMTLASPIDTISAFGSAIGDIARVYEINQQLQTENARLKQWQQVAVNLEQENQSLRELMHLVPKEAHGFISAEVVSLNSGPFVRSAIINAGHNHGVVAGQAVINQDGLLGRIAEAGASTSRLLLVTDINSRVPVITETTRERGILAGNNAALPELLYVRSEHRLEPGEKLITSGDGGLLPKGLPVGEISYSHHGDKIQVLPVLSSGSLDYVTVVDVQEALPPETAAP